MIKKSEEWFKQADYDMDTAKAMFDAGRYIYTVFMCHLSIEKALKGLYSKKLKELPPKTHNLIFLVEKIQLLVPAEFEEWLFLLNRLSIPSRYPDDLQKIQSEYSKKKTAKLLQKNREILQWLKNQ